MHIQEHRLLDGQWTAHCGPFAVSISPIQMSCKRLPFPDHSRSKVMAYNESSCVIFHQTIIQPKYVSLIVFEILTKNVMFDLIRSKVKLI